MGEKRSERLGYRRERERKKKTHYVGANVRTADRKRKRNLTGRHRDEENVQTQVTEEQNVYHT